MPSPTFDPNAPVPDGGFDSMTFSEFVRGTAKVLRLIAAELGEALRGEVRGLWEAVTEDIGGLLFFRFLASLVAYVV